LTQTSTKARTEIEPQLPENFLPFEEDSRAARARWISKLRLLWSERRFLLRVTAVGLVVGIITAFLIPARYDATTQIMPPDSQSSGTLALIAGLTSQPGSSGGGLGAMASDFLGFKSTGALFVGVLQSRSVQDRIVDKFDLKKVYGKRLEQAARNKLAEKTSVTEDRKSGIITVTVSDHDPKRAAAIAAEYVVGLDMLMAQLTTSSAHRERVFLEGRLNTVNADLELAEKDFSQFASKNATIDITEQGKAMVVAAASLEGELIAAQSELEGMKQIYSDSNVRVRAIEARIAELHHQLELFGGKTGTQPSGDNSAANATAPNGDYPTMRQLPILGVPYADLFRKLKVEQAVYETLTKEYELAKVQEAKEIPTVKVLDAPVVPETRSFPPRLPIMFLGASMAFILGVTFVMGKVQWREVDPTDPGKLFVQQVVHNLGARLARISPNGSASVANQVADGDRSDPSEHRSRE
jgi:uncharacterized protein involved in exopolysaccharide biosynthesis